MKTILRSTFAFVCTLLASGMDSHAQAPVTNSRSLAPLGLLRLKDAVKPGHAVPLAANKFAVDGLSVGGATGSHNVKKDNVDVLILESGREWSRPLRGSSHEVSFVSFQFHGSRSTIVDVGGARLGLTASLIGDNLQLMFDDSATGTLQWKSLNFHLGAAKYDGKNLAALPTLTVRLDPATSTWDLYLGSRLLADNLPMIAAKKDQRNFTVRAGAEGAWLTGLVMADENPLYEDANANGIDDAFEKQTRGALLAADTPAIVRTALAQQWKAAQRVKAPPALYLKRPAPDGAVAAAKPKS